MAEVLKAKARDALVHLTERELHAKFGTLNHKQQSIAATKFYIREIHNPVATVIDDDDIDLGIVDGGNDLGCDFIHRDDGRVLIIQSKYRAPGAVEKTEEITRFRNVLKSFRDTKQQPNARLADAIANIDWENDQFELVFFTFAKIKDQARAVSQQTPDYPADVRDLDERCDWKFLDELEINVALRNAQSLAAGISDKPFTLYPKGAKNQRGQSVISIAAGNHNSYVMTLDANQLVNAYKALGQDAIFSLNIRNFVGKTRTNKQIVETARNDPENFYMFNNGISCLATRVNVTENAVEVIGLQVINGAQTVRSLAHVGKFGSHVPFVLVRITEISEGYGSGGKIREQITRFNNTQNTIKLSDFRSNDPVQSGLSDQFKQIVRKGRKVAYLPKRTDKIPANHEVIRLEEFAKSVYAFLYSPTEFTASTSFLFDDGEKGGYAAVFGDGNYVWERMPDDEFEMRAAMYWIAQDFGENLRAAREKTADSDARAALERKWLLIYAAACCFKYSYNNDEWKIQLRKLYRGDWSVGGSDRKSQIIDSIFRASIAGVTTAYKNEKNNNKAFEHRRWIRSKETPARIRTVLNDIVLPLQPPLGDIPK